MALLQRPQFGRAPFRVQQFAVWTLTDNPSRRGFVGLGSGISGTGPSDEEIDAIRALFEAAGVAPGAYRATR